MDVKYNPLKYVPCPVLQGYFMLVLFAIWSAFFRTYCLILFRFHQLQYCDQHHHTFGCDNSINNHECSIY